LKRALHRLAIWAEKITHPLTSTSQKPPVIEPYLGFATSTGVVVRGRALTGLRRTTPDPRHGRFTNFRQMVGLFLTDEVAGVRVRAISQDRSVRTDEEGYFRLDLPRAALQPGWHTIALDIPGQADSVVMADTMFTDPDARYGVISDIDDTLMQTGAYSVLRNLWTSLTGSALTRQVFADAVDLIDRLHDGRNPVYYVSSSPWNLHAFLDNVLFTRAGLVRGPLFLRDLGISPTQFVSSTHGEHKGAQIDILFEAHPHLRFVLIGDSGQHDAEVYRDAASRWPGRIAQVVLRKANPRPDAAVDLALEDLRAMGIPVWTGEDYTTVELSNLQGASKA